MTRGSEPGYRRQPKIYRLTFADHPGLVVRAKSASVDMFLKVTEMNEQEITPDIAKDMLTMFADQLISWNLEDEDGQPVPATAEGLFGEDFDFVQTILLGWMDAVAGVSAPLAQPSSGGSPSPAESLPMEPLLPSLVS